MNERLFLLILLVLMGAGWGLSLPLIKIAVSTGHQPFGLIFWQLFIVVAILAAVNKLRGKPLVFGRRYLRLFIVVAMFGAILPDIFFYIAAAKLPSGVMAIVVSMVPMFSLPIAMMLGNERFSLLRLVGLSCGMVGIILLIGPDTSLPDPALAVFVLIALCAPVFYATEGNLVALWGTDGLDSVQVLLAASMIGVIAILPIAVITGQWINPLETFGIPELAFTISGIIHGIVYAGYVWLITKAGSVFAAQIAYLVTGFGVFWSLILLGESYSPFIWLALGLMFLGLFLVRPRHGVMLAPAGRIGEGEISRDKGEKE